MLANTLSTRTNPITVLPANDGFRESPAPEIAEALARSHGAHILLIEPVAKVLPAAFEVTGTTLVLLDPALREARWSMCWSTTPLSGIPVLMIASARWSTTRREC